MDKKEAGDRYTEIKSRLCGFAENDADIHAVIMIGSYTRKDVPADEFSDLDVFIVTDKPEKWFSGEYPSLLGKMEISFIEPTLGGGKEKRCVYDKDKDVDMIVLTPEQFDKALEEGVLEWVMNRGYNVLYADSEKYAERAARYVRTVVSRPEMSEEEFLNIVGDFYFHNIWACKKLLRGELWAAKICIDGYLKDRLRKMIEEYCTLTSGTDVWHDGRFIDRWAEPSVLDELKGCFAHYDTADCKKALIATHKLFARLARDVAEKRGYNYPEEAETCAAGYIGAGRQ